MNGFCDIHIICFLRGLLNNYVNTPRSATLFTRSRSSLKLFLSSHQSTEQFLLHSESYSVSLYIMVNSNLRGAHRLQKRIRLPSHGHVTARSLMEDVYVT